MKAQSRRGVSGRFGLALLIAWPTLVIGLSAIGERVALIYAVALSGILPALLGAVTWLRAGQSHWRVILQKRLVAITCFAAVVSVPLTHWPLYLSFLAARPAMERLANRVAPRLFVLSEKPFAQTIPVQADLNPPVYCGLLKIETIGVDWVYGGCHGEHYGRVQFWRNREGSGPSFFGDWRDDSKTVLLDNDIVLNTPTPLLMRLR